MARKAIVVGGGIGGLTAGLALIARGWEVQVLERTASLGEVGAGLSVWPNGLRALNVLGLGEQVRSQALTETEGGIRAVSGRWLSRTDNAELERKLGPLVMIHRARLFDILRSALPEKSLRVASKVVSVDDDAPSVEIEGGSILHADLVVAADGIRSGIRAQLWPEASEPRYVGYTSWRLIVQPPKPLTVAGETWGRGERIGLAQLPDGRVYVFAVAGVPAGGRSADGELAELRRRFGDWHEPIPELLAAASDEAVLRHDIYELPSLQTFVGGKVALLGDAAHAMTPNLGQGANQALEDAVTLAALLDQNLDLDTALKEYDRIRRPRAQAIALRSYRIGAVAQWSWPPAIALRSAIMSMTPSGAMMRAMSSVLDWTPPGSN